jgi:altronate dehydratase small subunit
MAIEAIVINEKDNVATALADLAAGAQARTRRGDHVAGFQIRQPIPYGHKFSISRIEAGEKVIKYGEVIGEATQQIEAGDHVHVQNVVSLRGRGDLHE